MSTRLSQLRPGHQLASREELERVCARIKSGIITAGDAQFLAYESTQAFYALERLWELLDPADKAIEVLEEIRRGLEARA